MLEQITVRVELGPYVLRGREVEFLEVQQAVGEHARCELAFQRDPKAVASAAATLRVGELANAAVRVVFVADGGDECLAFEGRVRDAEIDHLATGAGNVTVLALSDSYTLSEHVDRQYLREHTLPAVAGKLGVRVVGTLPTGAARDYMQAGTSAWAFLAQIAAEEGLQLRARWPRTPDGAADEPAELARGFADQTHTLTWGRELLRLSTTLAPVNVGVTGAFYDPAEKHDHRFRGVRASVEWLGGAAPVVAAAKDVATRDADGGDPGHLEPGHVAGVRARTLTEFRDRLELESARRAGSAVRARGASVLPALRAGDRVQIEAAAIFEADVSGGELADRTGTFGLTAVVHRWTGTLYENAFTATPWGGYHPTPTAARAPGVRANGGSALGAGLSLAVVVDNADPKGRGRVRVRFAYMSEGEQSHWIRVAGLGGGNTRGVGVLPSKGDEVVVAAVAGDPEHPVVLGALWNGVDRASHAPGRQVWITPAGNTLVFLEGEPGDGSETVELYSREGNTWVQLAQKGPTGVPTVTVHSEGDLALEAPKGEVRLTAKSYLAHVTEDHATQAGGVYTVKSTGAYTVESGARLALKAGADFVTVAGGTLRAHAGGVHTLTGSQVTQNPPGASAPAVTASVPAEGASAWGPRPVPPPGPGRSTEDPKTPTQKELAAKAARTSVGPAGASASTGSGVTTDASSLGAFTGASPTGNASDQSSTSGVSNGFAPVAGGASTGNPGGGGGPPGSTSPPPAVAQPPLAYPPRTADARAECQHVVATMASMGLSTKTRNVVTAFTHEDGTVSVGISGQDTRGNADVAQRVEAELNQGLSTRKYQVAHHTMPTDHILERTGGNSPGVCGEPHAAEAAHGNPSPITGMDTRWRGAAANPYPFTASNANGAPADPSQMDPCPTCEYPPNVDVYMDHAHG